MKKRREQHTGKLVYIILSTGGKKMDSINGRPDKILESTKLRAIFSKSRPRMT